MSIVLKHRRGLETALPTLAEAELWFSKDNYKLFIGSATGNIQFAKQSDLITGLSLKVNLTDFTSDLALKAPLASPTFTGLVTISNRRISFADANNNVAIGANAMLIEPTTGSDNTACGSSALIRCVNGGSNVAVGRGSLYLNVSGSSNTAIGAGALGANTNSYNTAVGKDALLLSIGSCNVAVGVQALFANVASGSNTGIGTAVLFKNTGGSNTGLGNEALHENVTGNNLVGLGSFAGYYETASNKLFIDTFQRTSEADGRLKALIYGIFDAATANQRLRINGRLGVTECPNYANNAAAVAGGLASGELYTVTGTDPLQVAKVI